MRAIAIIPAFVTVLLWWTPGFAAEPLDCARCHQNPAMAPTLKNEFGVPESLYIDPETFQQSWHYKFGHKTQCAECHKNITAFPHQPGPPRLCSNCHEDDKKPMFEAIEARVAQSVHHRLDCNDCHDVHRNKPAAEMTRAEKNQGCLKCHQYGRSPQARAGIMPTDIAIYHSWHPQAKLHLDRMACIVCHTNMPANDDAGDDAAFADKHLILDKSHAARDCSVCHRADTKVAKYLIDVGGEQGSGRTPAQALKTLYLVGGTREPIIEIIGGSILLLTIIGGFGHGAARVVLARRRRS